MKRNYAIITGIAAGVLMLATTVSAAPQGRGGGGQGGGGGFGGGQGGGMGRGGGMDGRMQPPPVSAATIPLEAMTDYLQLTTAQVSKIKAITQAVRENNRPPRPEPGQDGERPAPPTQAEREAQRKTMDAAMTQASADITAVLTDTQKPRLSTLVKGFEAMQGARIPPFAVQDLKLTDDQWTKIAALGKTATRDSVAALLTDTQKTALESARPPRGGRGGGGGGRPGGPPPDGGFGGPPPPDGE